MVFTVQKIIKQSILMIYTLFLIIAFIFKFLFLRFKHYEIYIIDIDNTIADTWPTLKIIDSYLTEFERYASLRAFNQIKDYMYNTLMIKSKLKLFLSARNILMSKTTENWLINNGYYDKLSNLMLVPNASYKLPFLKILILLKYKIVYIDDLSYNHENLNILFYNKVINFVTNSKQIKYIGYEEIKKYHAY